MSFVIAIDGPAGAGKGTITELVGQKLGAINIDTGAMYRCITLYMIRNHINIGNIKRIEELLNNIIIELTEKKIYLNGEDVTDLIREKEVNELVSQVSHIQIVRNNMVKLQRKMAEGKNVIMEGRDIGTNVFPNAEVKIYLDATPEERAKRRVKQNEEKGIKIPYKDILENIKFRDNNDKNSDVAPLKQAENAIYIDSSNLTIDEVVDKVIEIAKKTLNC